MLNGYDNPNPTPRIPIVRSLTDWNKQWPKPGRDRVRPVKPFSERVLDHIDAEEAAGEVARQRTFIVTGGTEIWRKMGQRTFYRLYGLHNIQHTEKHNGIQEAINKANSRVFIKDASYLCNTAITPKTGIRIEGETSYGTKLQANAASLKIFDQTATVMTNIRIWHIGLDANSQTGLVGYNGNISANEAPTNNWFYDWKFFNSVSGAFTTAIDLTGNEETVVDLMDFGSVTGQGYGEFYLMAAKFAGWIKGSRIFYSQASGTSAAVHVVGGQVVIADSVLNSIVFDNQSPGDYNTIGHLAVMDTYMANSQPTGTRKFATGVGTQAGSVLSFEMRGCYIGLANSEACWANTQTRAMNMYRAHVQGTYFTNIDGSAVTWINSSGTGGIVMGGELHWNGNNQGGTITEGGIMTGGYGQYYFEPPPAGWGWKSGGGFGTGANTQAVPAGTGSGNAVRNRANRPVRVYAAGTIAGTHIIDAEGMLKTTQTDLLVGTEPAMFDLFPFEQVYYATTVPTSWKWYGL